MGGSTTTTKPPASRAGRSRRRRRSSRSSRSSSNSSPQQKRSQCLRLRRWCRSSKRVPHLYSRCGCPPQRLLSCRRHCIIRASSAPSSSAYGPPVRAKADTLPKLLPGRCCVQFQMQLLYRLVPMSLYCCHSQAEEPKAEPRVEPKPDPTGKHMYATKVRRSLLPDAVRLLERAVLRAPRVRSRTCICSHNVVKRLSMCHVAALDPPCSCSRALIGSHHRVLRSRRGMSTWTHAPPAHAHAGGCQGCVQAVAP